MTFIGSLIATYARLRRQRLPHVHVRVECSVPGLPNFSLVYG